ncbi:outer membrane protein assembly factor BamE domain-containing protein [Candidatus Electronema sp. JC]|uniref:outer membrane protein assembly factor BamE domain-containing protein n=1 Tax=Candidatus Electronema sp. JC TaxID=3401570 RepID=UPI003B433E1C
MRHLLFFLLAALAVTGGCSFKPVRHLASDAALIKPGESTRKDVLRYLGEPDGRRTVGPGVEEYLYSETRKGQLGGLPLVGRLADPASQEMVVVTLNGEQVASCEFRLLKKDDLAWKKDAQWEDVR